MQNTGKDKSGVAGSKGKDEGKKFAGAEGQKDTIQVGNTEVRIAFKIPAKTLEQAVKILKEFGCTMLQEPRGSKFDFRGHDKKLCKEVGRLCNEAFRYGLTTGVQLEKQSRQQASRILKPDGLGSFAKSLLPVKGGKDA